MLVVILVVLGFVELEKSALHLQRGRWSSSLRSGLIFYKYYVDAILSLLVIHCTALLGLAFVLKINWKEMGCFDLILHQ